MLLSRPIAAKVVAHRHLGSILTIILATNQDDCEGFKNWDCARILGTAAPGRPEVRAETADRKGGYAALWLPV